MNQIQLMQMIPIAGKLGLARRWSARAHRRRGARRGHPVGRRSRAAMAFYELYETDQSIAVALETQRLLRDLATTARCTPSARPGSPTCCGRRSSSPA